MAQQEDDARGIVPGPEEMERLLKWAMRYNDHLNVCERCRKDPFDLCAEGEKILKKMPTE